MLIAIALGIGIGLVAPDLASQLKPLGDGFIKLVKMTIAPVIFCTVVGGIAGMKSIKAVGKAGGLAILYFEIMSTIALVIGLVIVNVTKPGVGMNIDPHKLDAGAVAQYTGTGHQMSPVDFLLGVIPDTFVGAFAHGELLPVLVLALLFGFALHRSGEGEKPILAFVDRIGHVMFGPQ